MAFSREPPDSFRAALKMAQNLIERNSELAKRGTAAAEAEQILAAALRKTGQRALTRLEIYSRLNDRLSADAGQWVMIMAAARGEGKILQHLTGTQVFLGHEYEVGNDVLVPRPETEVLLSFAIDQITQSGAHPQLGIEIGIGSGVISIELLHHFRSLSMRASEASPAAAARALTNARRILGQAPAGKSV
jgi:release factor glutamine methyltransferase